MQLNERCRLLQSVEILHGLPPTEIDALAQRCRWLKFSRDQQILTHLDESTQIHFLVSGRARIVIHSRTGKAVLLSDLEPGGVFGEIAALDGQPRSASVEAIDDCIVAALAASDFDSLMQRQPRIAIALLKTLAAHIRRLDQRVLEFSTLTVRGRFLVELLRMARHIDPTANEVTLIPAPSLLEYSGRISSHREAISREFSRLAQLGIIQRDGGNLKVLDLRRLEALANAAHES